VAHEVSCGLIVDYNDINHINNAIVTLRDKPDPRRELGDNGRRAFLQKFNWHIIEKELLKVYETLFASDI
jgi:glycosyltransferase involved in cell wall biosynthesis